MDILLKTILIMVLVYYALKLLIRYLGPYLLQYAAKKVGKRFERTFREAYGQDQSGNVSVDKMPKKGKNSKNTLGEYVDYEELD